MTKPTLVWKISTTRAGKHDAQVTYQTDGLTWRADYSLVVNEKDTAADVSAWVTLLNESGASYPDAKLKLVAGDVQRIKPPEQVYQRQMLQSAGRADKDGGFVEKSFFEYHLYTLGRTTSLSNNSTKQIELFPMSEEEAIDQLELIGHDFFVFVNAASGKVNVLYRREDGNYGLLDPVVS